MHVANIVAGILLSKKQNIHMHGSAAVNAFMKALQKIHALKKSACIAAIHFKHADMMLNSVGKNAMAWQAEQKYEMRNVTA